MADNELRPVYLLTGTDRPKLETALLRLRRHFERDAIESVSALEVSGADAVHLCNAGSLFGDSRLVIVDRVDGLQRDDGRRTGGWKAADVEAVASYLKAPASDTVLALVAEDLAAGSPLGKACAKAGDVLAFVVPKRGVTSWVAERFVQRGVRADADAAAVLVHLVGENPQALAGEIDKIAIWAGDEPVGEREVLQLVAATATAPTFVLTDAWGDRDSARMLEASEEMLERSDRPRRDDAARIAGALGSHLGRLRQLKRLAAEGVSPREAAGKLRMHPYYADKVSKQAEKFGNEELGDATVRLAALDLALKGESKLAPEIELQRALIDLGRSAERS